MRINFSSTPLLLLLAHIVYSSGTRVELKSTDFSLLRDDGQTKKHDVEAYVANGECAGPTSPPRYIR